MTVRNWADFVDAATQVANETGYPLAVLLGQAAIETGRNVGNAPGNNFFGIKGQGNAGAQKLLTWEDYGQGPVNIYDNFAAFATPEDAIRAYVNLIRNNYPDAWRLRNNPTEMITAIKRGGYATDPQYVNKVMSTPEFQQYQGAFAKESTPEIPKDLGKNEYSETIKRALAPPVEAAEVQQYPYQQNANYNLAGMPTPTPRQSSLTYKVQPGDTLWGTAEKFLGSGQRWKEIKGYSGDPTRMPVGTKLTIQKSTPSPQPTFSQPRTPAPSAQMRSTPMSYSPPRSGGGGGGGGGGSWTAPAPKPTPQPAYKAPASSVVRALSQPKVSAPSAQIKSSPKPAPNQSSQSMAKTVQNAVKSVVNTIINLFRRK